MAAAANNPTASSIPSIQVHHLISVKLDNTNYLLWLTQFQPLLKGYDLEGYVDGSHPCPPRCLPDSTDVNPAYVTWQKQDQIFLGWLLSSLTEPVLAQVVGLTTSRAVWESLQRHFSSQSQARTLHLKRELQNMRKGNKTMAEYYLHAKQLADKLAACGKTVSNTDLQHMMLGGLDSSYDPIVTVLTTSTAELHMDDFYSNLLAYEMRLEAQAANFPQPMANLAHRGRFRSSNGAANINGNREKPISQGSRSKPPLKTQQRPFVPRLGTGPCQICGRQKTRLLTAGIALIEHPLQPPL